MLQVGECAARGNRSGGSGFVGESRFWALFWREEDGLGSWVERFENESRILGLITDFGGKMWRGLCRKTLV